MSQQTIKIDILRYRPEMDDKPFTQTFELPYKADMSVLEVLQYIKDNLDSTISFRWSCRMAICGSCGLMVCQNWVAKPSYVITILRISV